LSFHQEELGTKSETVQSDAWPDTVFNVDDLETPLQARFGHTEIFRYPTEWGFAPPSDCDNIITEFLKKCVRHDDHPSARTEILTALVTCPMVWLPVLV